MSRFPSVTALLLAFVVAGVLGAPGDAAGLADPTVSPAPSNNAAAGAPISILLCEQYKSPSVSDVTAEKSGMTRVQFKNVSAKVLTGVAILVDESGSYASTREAKGNFAPGATVDLVLSDPTLPFYNDDTVRCSAFAAQFQDGTTWESQTDAINAFKSTSASSMPLSGAESALDNASAALRPPTISLGKYCSDWDQLAKLRSSASEAQIEADYGRFDQTERRIAAGYYHCYQQLEASTGIRESYARDKLLLLYLQTLKATLGARTDAREVSWIVTLGTQLQGQTRFVDINSGTKELLDSLPQSTGTPANTSADPGVSSKPTLIDYQGCSNSGFSAALSTWESDFDVYAGDADGVRQMLALKATTFNEIAFTAALATEVAALKHAQNDEGSLQQSLYAVESSHAVETARSLARVMADVQTTDSYAASYTAARNMNRDDAENIRAGRISVSTDVTQINPDTLCKS